MAGFSPKVYQQQVLESVEAYFRACHELPSPGVAFNAVTERLWGKNVAYNPIADFPKDMPYFCLRVPTGGGKTWLAAKSLQLVNTHLLRCEHSMILWLVPSKAIREQTLRALRDREHPYAAALREAGPVTVLDLEEAKNVTRATLETSTAVIVSTVQAFRREDTEGLKVYESSGALMHHFDQLTPEQRSGLLADAETTPYSLANVLRLRRPFLVVDEAHNNRTPLSFKTFAEFRPSGIMELTATPDTKETPSNVLHSVSAAELKAEEMIKLPIVLETEPNWQQCLADAIARRGELQTLADAERRNGNGYLRPVVLIQAEKRRQGVETLDVERVRKELGENHRIPVEEIVVATGEEKGLEKLNADYPRGIADEKCPVRFVITQQALAEGWDCPFAYILVSMAELHSATAVEQLLGRVLRQPEAKHREARALNQSYAFVVSEDFGATARSLRDRLVEGAGFERREVAEFVAAAKAEQLPFDLEGHPGRIVIHPVVVPLPEKPDLKRVPKPVREKLTWDDKAQTLTIAHPLNPEEEEAVKQAVSGEAARQAIQQAAEASRTQAIEFFQTPAEQGMRFAVPQMALRIQGKLALFDDPEVLDYPWDLSLYDATSSADEMAALNAALKVSEGGEIDVDEATGKVTTRFIADLQRDLGFAYRPEHWDEVKLAAWLCRNLPEQSVTHASKQAFVVKWLKDLLVQPGCDLGRANRQKFLIRNLLEARIRNLRLAAVKQAYQQTLFGDDRASRVAVDETYRFEFHPQAYAPSRDYDPRVGGYLFRKHYYGRIGDFDSQEEFECAVWLDTQAQRGRIDYWVRNLVRKEGCSFFLQKADGRFYPDFLCRLPSGVVLAVEYKGADRWKDAEDDRLIGGLWAELSDARCRFVMVTEKKWELIDAKL
ncbi:MAG: DEAD/DEAH box helicase family protein [Betaproteobacteria bacterium]|nr:DEAD/DEAH box helicase family protein [Betaproteobacteria bacterium]